jgi:hypothetical protein
METPADTTTPKEKRFINWGALILWPVVIVILYVLSFGPVVMMIRTGKIPAESVIPSFYKPMFWAYMKTPLHKPLGLYFHWWDPFHFDKKGDYRRRE